MKTFKKLLVRLVSTLLLFALLLPQGEVFAHAALQTDDTLQQCDLVSEEALQDELNSITQEVVTGAADKIDVAAIIDKKWVTLKVDATIEAEVDRAVEQVKNEADLWNKFLSGWSTDAAKELTTAVANRTFESTAFRGKIDELSNAVAEELSKQIAVLSAQSVSAAFFCLQTFITGNYSSALVTAFEEEVRVATESHNLSAKDELDSSLLSIIGQHETALGGVGVIIVAQVSKRIMVEIGEAISERIAGRIIGRILGRAGSTIIPIAGWLIGAGMIAYDLYNNRDGALPQIQETLKSEEVKAGIRGEIAASIEPELRRELPQIARDISVQLFNEWRDVKRNIRQVLELARENENFRTLLNGQETPTALSKLVNLVGIAMPALGREAVMKAVDDGSFAKVFAQPEAAFAIVEANGSFQSALDWATQAGNTIDKVVEFEVYKHKAPTDLEPGLLEKLVTLNDKAAVQKLALLPADALAALLTVSTDNLITLANQLEAGDLELVAGYLPTLNQNQVNQLVARLISNPATVQQLQDPALRDYLATDSNLDSTLGFLLTPADNLAIVTDALKVATGDVGWRLLLFKYGLGQSALVVAGAVVAALIAIRVVLGLLAWLVSPITSLFRRG